MNSRAAHHLEDINDAGDFGEYISEPSYQLVRLIGLFPPNHRASFIRDAYDVMESVTFGKRTSIDRFIAMMLLDAGEVSHIDRERLRREPDILNDINHGIAAAIPDWLLKGTGNEIGNVINGKDARRVAIVLSGSLLNTSLTFNEELLSLLSRSLASVIITPEQAAAIASAVDYNARDVVRFEETATYLIEDLPLVSKRWFETRRNWNSFSDRAKHLKHLMNGLGKQRIAAQKQIAELAQPHVLCDRHRLHRETTGIFIPLRKHLIVAKSIADAEKMARDSKGIMHAMEPREFERFMAEVFKELGYEVELTKATRDGGADLICMRTMHGIPFRLAVEIKRYRDKPIDVHLVRSFVGSNVQWNANKMVYVTTSRYTSSAHDFADKYASHLLSLKGYDQIAEWCDMVSRDKVKLL